MRAKLVLLRHGQSVWNEENKFTGWADAPLSARGKKEARRAAVLLINAGLTFDCAFSSVLQRAVGTLWRVLETMELSWLPVEKDWRLNERHYGALQGKNKAQTIVQFGEAQVRLWRRGFSAVPPPGAGDEKNDRRYQNITPPRAESLQSAMPRVVKCWTEKIEPQIKNNRRVLVVAHGNSLRALIKHLENIGDDDISGLNIATAQPILYEFENGDAPQKKYLPEA